MRFTPLTTKLHIPVSRETLVKRPRLIQSLERSVRSKLCLLSAPAGFGKTTLLAAWSQRSQWPVAWVSLDAMDNDALRFWSYIVAALDKVEPCVGQHVLPLLQSSQAPDMAYVLTALINAVVDVATDFVLVLDDYHVITSEAIHKWLAYLIDYLPLNMHILISSRAETPLPLSRWRARRDLSALNGSDLRFSLAETESLVKQTLSPALTKEAIVALHKRTEGWATALHLALLSAGQHMDQFSHDTLSLVHGDQQHIAGYLASEVLAQQPVAVREFLLQTSILEVLQADVCDAVTQQTNSGVVLDNLYRQGLFITAINHNGAYRYHALFADFLQSQLSRYPDYKLPELHHRAAQWYAQQGDIDRAIDHMLAAGDYEAATGLVADCARDYVLRGEFSTLRRWFAALLEHYIQATKKVLIAYDPTARHPEQSRGVSTFSSALDHPVVVTRHNLLLFYAWVLTNAGAVEQAEDYLAALDADDTLDPALRGEIAVVRARCAVMQSDTAANMHFSKQALDLLPDDASLLRGEVALGLAFAHSDQQDFTTSREYFEQAIARACEVKNLRTAMLALYYLANTYVLQAQLPGAAQAYQRGLRLCAQVTPSSPLACWAYAGLGALAYEWNDLSQAVDHLQTALTLAQQCGEVKVLIYARKSLALVWQAQGRYKDALVLLQEAGEIATQADIPSLISEVNVARIAIWIREGDLDTAANWTRLHGLSLEQANIPDDALTMLAGLYIAQAQSLPRSGRHALLEPVMGLLRSRCDVRHTRELIRFSIQDALALVIAGQLLGDRSQALSLLKTAVNLAAPSALVRTFVDCGPEYLVPLLREMRGGAHDNYLNQLLSAFGEAKTPSRGTGRSAAAPRHQTWVDSLRPREIEVLHHIAKGHTNKEIANEMVMAESTVKWYLRNIYGKLHVNRRTQAVARARELNLI